jgi:hypothetical protein
MRTITSDVTFQYSWAQVAGHVWAALTNFGTNAGQALRMTGSFSSRARRTRLDWRR